MAAGNKRRKSGRAGPASARAHASTESGTPSVTARSTSAPSTSAQSGPETEPDVPEVERKDLWVAGAVAVGAACVFATTFSASVALGDAPETVAGVKALGVLHSPGYPSYVLVAHAFGDVFAVGSWAFRVNVFSVLCSSVMVGAIYVLARCLRATRAGAAVGALAVAVSASVWFNAGFAKHYAFTGMLVAVGGALVLLWVARGRNWLLVTAAALFGVCLGSGWEIALIMVAASVILFFAGSRRPGRGLAIGSVFLMAALGVASYTFLVVRAGQHPPVNWGEATSGSRLLALLSDRDFQAAGIAPSHANIALRIPIRLFAYGGIELRDLGLGAAVMAIVGIAFAWKRLERGPKLFLAALAVLNLLSVTTAIGFIEQIMGFRTSLIAGGYLLDLMLVFGVLIAIAFTPLTRAASSFVAEMTTPTRYKSHLPAKARSVYPIVGVVIAALIIGPSLVFHYQPANHRIPPLADRYGSRVLDSLPSGGVLVILSADWAFPPIYRQVVDGQRRDVSVLNVDSVGLGWYRDELARELKVQVPSSGTPLNIAIALIQELRRSRPVYFDTSAMQLFQGNFGYRVNGLVAEVVAGKGPQPVPDLATASAQLQAIDRADGVTGHRYLRFPNESVQFFHERAHIELAKAYLLAHNPPGALTELQRASAIEPDDTQTHNLVLFMEQRGTGADDVILQM